MNIIMTSVETVGMSDELLGAIITAIVTSIISIIGFIVTNISMRKSFKNELTRERDGIALEKMATIPYETLDFYDLTMKSGRVEEELETYLVGNLSKQQLIEKKRLEQEQQMVAEQLLEKMNYLYNTIYAYGSPTAIKIVSKMQSSNYALTENSTEEERLKILAYMILLATQVKKDVTTVVVNPKYWLQLRINDYHINHEKIDAVINAAIKELKLDKKFKI